MDLATARRIADNPAAAAAAAQFQRAPMQTDTDTYRRAVDFFEAILVIASAEGTARQASA